MRAALSSIRSALVVGVVALAVAAGTVVPPSPTAVATLDPLMLVSGGSQPTDKPWD